MRKTKHILRFFVVISLLGLFLLGGTAALAAETADVPLTVTYGQTEARTMLDLINAFRQSSDAWYWNEDNSTKTTCKNLKPLVYDYDLEKVAMQRAAEIVLRFDHTRPDGSKCTSIYPSNLTYTGENIYSGSVGGTQRPFTAWQETNKDYGGQGHRRNMLSNKFNAVGIGHAVYNGVHYWVQVFGYTSSPNTSPTAAVDSEREVSVHITADSHQTKPAIENGTLSYGSLGYLPAATTYVTSYNTFTIYSDVIYTSDDTSVVKVDGTKLVPVKLGTATLRGTAKDGTSLTTTIRVVPLALDKAAKLTVSSAPLVYTGKALTPGVTVKLDSSVSGIVLTSDGKTLTKDVDYTVTCTENTNVGTGTVKVTGKGNYTGELYGTFTIVGKSLSGAKITLSQNTFTFNGKEQAPDVTVTMGGTTLRKGTDYYLKTEKLSGGKNAGTYSVTAHAFDGSNYSGSVSATYTVKPADISKAQLTDFSHTNHVYSGNPIEPTVQVKPDGKTALSKDYYTVTYKNNTEVGTATVTVTGKDGYSGTASTTFRIVPIDLGKATVTLSPEKYDYDGKAKTPSVTVTMNGKTLKKGTDYTVAYSDNVTPQSGTVTITGIGHYGGKKNVTFPIKGTIRITGDTVTYISPDGKISNSEPKDPTATTKPTATPKPTTAAKAGWQKTGGKWWYRNADGSYPRNTWQKIGRKWYHFDKSGYMQTGWQKIGKAWYYLGSDGAMATGWQKIGKTWYYFQSSGAMQTGWMKSGRAWYYFQSSGAMATGWQKIGRTWYYFQSSGAMQTGWMKSGSTWYYFKSSGAMAANETVNGYKFDSSGRWLG